MRALHPNIDKWQRAASIGAGALLLAAAARRRSGSRIARSSTGLALIARGVSGWCPVTATVGRRRDDTRKALGGSRGVRLQDSVVVARPIEDVFAYWRDLRNLPTFMRHIESVDPIDAVRSHWVVRGPGGMRAEWDSEIISEVAPSVIGWRSLPGAEVASAGSVRFTPLSEGRTRIDVHLQYDAFGGRAADWLATRLGVGPAQELHDDLQRLKAGLEAYPGATAGARIDGGDGTGW